MTVPSTTRRAGPYLGNGVTTSFPFSFKVFSNEDIALTLTDADGFDHALVLDSDYSVTINPDQDSDPGGSITYPLSGDPLATGETLVGVGSIPYDQTTDLPTGGAYRATTVENTFDRTVFQIQQLAEVSGRALTLPPTAADADPELPYPETQKIIGWNQFTDVADAEMINYSPADLATVVVAGTGYFNVFDGTGAQTQFPLTADPGNVNALDVVVDGVPQKNGIDFTASGTTLTFVTAPGPGTQNVAARYVAAVPVGSANAQDVAFIQTGAGAVTRDAQSKMRERFSVADFGGVDPTGVSDSTVGIQAALTAAFNAGGGTVFVPKGTYKISSPLIVRSNTNLEGEGAASVILRTETSALTPENNLIHVGYGYEWDQNGVKFNPASNNDATLANLLANDFSRITTRNVAVRNLQVKSSGGGLGIWTMNAANVVIDSIWSDGTLTPVNIGNDAPGWECACYNVSVSNIFQISCDPLQSWYDLFFAGSVLKVSFSRGFNNPNTPTALDGAIVFSGTQQYTVSDCTVVYQSVTGKRGIVSTAVAPTTAVDATISGNTFKNCLDGIYLNGAYSLVSANKLIGCSTGVTVNGKYNLVDGNTFEANTTDVGGTADMVGNTFTNNKGLLTMVVSGFAFDPQEYNTVSGNTPLTVVPFNNYTQHAVMRARNIAFFPQDAWMSKTDTPKLFSDGAGAYISLNGGANTVTLFYKIPESVKKITSISVNGYADVAGESVTLSIAGINAQSNTNSIPVFQTFAARVSAAAGDFTYAFTGFNPLYALGTYYVKIVLSTTSNVSQLRNFMMIALSDE